MSERTKIAARIRALLAKTVENGCTEDEAVAAADLAAKLLANAFLTDTQTWSSDKGKYPYSISFFGLDHEVEIAKYLLAICARAMRQEHRRLRALYGLLRPARQRLKIIPFLDGMADSLHARIRALKVVPPTGTGLVIVKGQLITEAMAAAGIKLDQIKMRASRTADEEYRLGVIAGERVSLNSGIRGGAGTDRRLIGG